MRISLLYSESVLLLIQMIFRLWSFSRVSLLSFQVVRRTYEVASGSKRDYPWTAFEAIYTPLAPDDAKFWADTRRQQLLPRSPLDFRLFKRTDEEMSERRGWSSFEVSAVCRSWITTTQKATTMMKSLE